MEYLGARASCPHCAWNCGAKCGQDARAAGYFQGTRLESGPQRPQENVKMQKNVKIAGTNSTSPLESIKASKNELKTNWFWSANELKTNPKTAQRTPFCVAPNQNSRVRRRRRVGV
jgi:hypothetical protein